MKSPFIQSLKVVLSNRGFILLAGITALSGLCSRVAYFQGRFSLAEDFFTLLFVFSLWMAFHFGILIKRQFANFQSSVLPGYRTAHMIAWLFIYALVIALEILWARGMRLDFPWLPKTSMPGVWALGLLVSLFIMGIGYLSMGRVLLYGYCMLLVASAFFVQVSDLYQANPGLVYVPFVLWGVGLGLFIWRLSTLREESIEYPHLLTWPPKDMAGTYRTARPARRLGRGILPRATAPRYPKFKNIFTRITHWDLALGDEPGLLRPVAWVIFGIYVLAFLKITWITEWLKAVYANFGVLVFTPLVMIVIRHYKLLVFWGYDTLRPLPKAQYIRDQIAGMFVQAGAYWVLTVLVLGLGPAKMFYGPDFLSASLGGYFFLTGCLLFLILSVLILLMTVEKVFWLLVHGGLLSAVILMLFDRAAGLTAAGYIFIGWACLAGGLIYIKQGYHAWCRKEYV